MVQVLIYILQRERERVIESAMLAVGKDALKSDGWKEKRSGVFVEVLMVRRRFLEVRVV